MKTNIDYTRVQLITSNPNKINLSLHCHEEPKTKEWNNGGRRVHKENLSEP